MARPFSNKKKPAPKKPAAPTQAATAFNKTLPEIEALSADRLIAVNLDIPRVVSQVLGVLLWPDTLLPRHQHAVTRDASLRQAFALIALAA